MAAGYFAGVKGGLLEMDSSRSKFGNHNWPMFGIHEAGRQ